MACTLLLNRPAAVGLDGLVYFLHQPDRLLERDDETLVVGDVLFGESAARFAALAASVVKPLVTDLVERAYTGRPRGSLRARQ